MVGMEYLVVMEEFTKKITSEPRQEGGKGVSLDISERKFKKRGQLVKGHSVGMCTCLRNSKKTI